MARTDHFEREAQRLLTQMFEVRSTFADIGQRQSAMSDLSDSVAIENMRLQLQGEREQAMHELNRINADMRILTLVKDEQTRKEAANIQQTARDEAAKAEILNRQTQAQQEIAQKDREALAAIARQDREKADAIAREEAAKNRPPDNAPAVDTAKAQTNTVDRSADATPAAEPASAAKTQANTLDRSADNNPVADATSAAAIASAKAADIWLEVFQLAKHAAERLAQERAQDLEREALEKKLAQEVHGLEWKMLENGKSEQELEEALKRQAEEHDRQREAQAERFEGERQELAADQVRLETDRNQRADKEGLSLGLTSGQLDMEQVKEPPQQVQEKEEKPLDNVGGRNAVADAFSAASIAAVKAVDVWIEVVQLARHLAEREAQKVLQEQQREEMEKAIARQAHDMEKSMTDRGKTREEIDEALKRQAEIHEKHRAEQEEKLERERQELAEKQVNKERERNERADRDGLSF